MWGRAVLTDAPLQCVVWFGILLPLCQMRSYTNRWAVKVSGGLDVADEIAEKYGFLNMGQIGNLENYYHFLHRGTMKRATVASRGNHSLIATETKVDWVQQQMVRRRMKRDDGSSLGRGHSRAAQPSQTLSPHFNDPKWDSMWYIHCDQNCLTDMNVRAAWGRGFTGRGVVVSILDDGIERLHPDLKQNYDARASYDINGNDPDPTPRYDATNENKHGTRCAGVVAAAANNSLCTVGIAHNARIGGVRMLDGDMTDMVEAQSLSLRQQYINIYSSSWGPDDDGRTVDSPGPLARLALENGIRRGRKGRGSIFVWASGNGGRNQDHCSCDGYTNSIYTISVGSTTQSGRKPWYLEECSSTLTTTYSSGESHRTGVVTTDLRQRCTEEHSGTSASAPMAAGIIALTLEANPSLTWRDVQHIIVKTSRPGHLSAPDWQTNGAGHDVSHLYGFGLMDAEAMVKEAEGWKQVPPQHVCVENPLQNTKLISPEQVLRSVYKSSGCSSQPLQRVAYLEHVIVRITVTHPHRGDLSVFLTSPAGTKSQLLANRPNDHSTEGFQRWDFMSTHCWGERPTGEWILEVRDTPSPRRNIRLLGRLVEWSLVLHGTAPPPYAAPRHEQPRSAEQSADVAGTEEYSGPCDPECSDDGCEGPGPQQCVSCLHFFLKFKNSTRACVAACPAGFWGDRKRCKRCYPSCETCQGSRGDQCTTCKPGHHLLEETGSCVTSCGDGFYLHHEDNVCRSCSPNCLKCTSSSICAECTDGMSLLGNRCQKSCGAGSFYSEHQGGCELCHPACATCAAAGMESCTRCAEDHLMEGWRCVPSCSPGFYAAQQSSGGTEPQDICKRCDTSCRACVGPGADSCTECDDGHTLRDGECVLTTDCQDGEYQDENGKCHSCHASCQKCRGPQREDCVTCPSSHWLEDGSCVARCPEGKYQLNGQCHLCDHTCAQCVDAGPANCTSCNTDKFGLDRYLYQGGCVDACPAAHYHSALNTCEACAEHCGLCASLTHCLKCNASYYLNHGVCTPLECGEGEVEDPEYDDCMPCEEGCRKCVLYNPKHCLSCIDGFYKFEEGCYKICPAKTYSIEEDMSCVPCERDCVSCDQEECHWCEADLFLSEGKCVRECPDGFYGDEDSQECESCHLDCGTCSGPEEDECDSCHEGLQLLESGECVPEQDLCPAKTYLTDDGDCESCHVSCDSCWGNLRSQCSSCVKGRYLSAEQTCVARCPAGSFGSKASGMCEGCPKGCAQCQDGQRCLRCQPGRKTPLYLQDGLCVPKCTRGHVVGQVCRSCAEGCASCDRNATHCLTCEEPLLLHKHQCVEACPPAHTSQEGECVRCPQTCLECSELGLCAVCEESTYLHEGQCVHMCPDGFYEDTKQGVCGRCHPDCELCDGPDPDNCDACTDPDAVLRDGACVSICPAHTYRDNLSGECRACDGTCLTCSGPHDTSCTSCNEGLRTDAHGRCATPTTCPAHHYANQDGECHLCHKYCKQCSGPDKHQCLSCNQNHFLLNDTCMNECPVGTFAGETQRCEPCHPNCQACVGRHSHECLSCRTHLFREGKECVETCHASHYGDVESGACERCDSSCGECLGAGPEGCVSCREGLLYIRKQGRCVPTCPTNYYHDNLHATCEPCHASCKTCSGKGDEACDSCHEGHILSGGVCEPLCIMGEYHVPEVDGYTCEPCDDSCVGCRGPGPHNCTACPEQGILTSEGRCLPCCKSQDSDKESKAAVQQECCNCTESRGECILRTNFAFHNHEEEEEPTGNLGLFITTSVLLLLGLAAVVILIKRSFSKRPTPDAAVARGYEKLGHGAGRHGGSHRSGTTSSSTSYGGQASSSSSGHFHADQLVDLSDRPSARDDDDEDDDEDIVYMGQDGTVYRKFRYGQLNEDQEDELEYDDESYTFR